MTDAFNYNDDYRIQCSNSNVGHTSLINGYEMDDLGATDLTWNDNEDNTPPDYDDDHNQQPPTTKRPKLAKADTTKCDTNHKQTNLQLLKSSAIDFSFHLSDEILVRLFKYLPKSSLYRCLQVCRRWRNIALDSSCWSSIDLNCNDIPIDILMMILERKVITARLSNTTICQPQCSNNDSMKTKKSSSLELKYLDATCCRIPDETMLSILKKTTKMRKVSFENTIWSDNVLKTLGHNENLTEVNLCSCQSLTDNAIKVIVKACKKIKCLNVAWTNIQRSGVELLCANLPALLELDVSGLRNSYDDDITEILATNHLQLKKLDISDCSQITNRSTELLSQYCKEIEFLAMSRCCNVSTDFVSTISAMAKLKDLQIFGFTNTNHIEFLQRSFQSLKINQKVFSNIARPCKGKRYESRIWHIPCT